MSIARRCTAGFALLALACLPAAAQAQALTNTERASLRKHLEATRQAFLDSIASVSDAQWTFKAAPGRWSIAEIAEHIAISESTILELITGKILKVPLAPGGGERLSDDQLLKGLLDRTNRFQAPEMLRPTGRWTTREALTKDFLAAREKTLAYVATTADDLHGHGVPHPVFLMLDGYQWLLLLSGHSARHTAQIEEVKGSTGYPGESASK